MTHANSLSHRHKSIKALFKENEREKKRMYGDRVLNIEKASFTPLVFSTTGGLAPECEALNKRLATLIAIKRGQSYSDVMRYVRTKLRFSLLRSVLVSIRGYRGKQYGRVDAYCDIDFNLIPASETE